MQITPSIRIDFCFSSLFLFFSVFGLISLKNNNNIHMQPSIPFLQLVLFAITLQRKARSNIHCINKCALDTIHTAKRMGTSNFGYYSVMHHGDWSSRKCSSHLHVHKVSSNYNTTLPAVFFSLFELFASDFRWYFFFLLHCRSYIHIQLSFA